MAVTIYRSDDASAPTLDGQAGSLIDVLLACLVNGYGAKSQAGWTLELDDSAANGVILLRNNAAQGTGRYFRIQDNGYYNQTAGKGTTHRQLAYVYGCETYVDINDTAGNFPNIGFQGDSNPDTSTHNGQMVMKSNFNGSSSPRAWIITADNRTCNMFIFYNTADMNLSGVSVDNASDYCSVTVLGDYDTLNNTVDPYACLCAANGFFTSHSTSYLYFPDTSSSSESSRFINRAISGATGAVESIIYTGAFWSFSTSVGAYAIGSDAGTNYVSYPDPAVGGLTSHHLYIGEKHAAVESTTPAESSGQLIRGRCRGIRGTLHTINNSAISSGYLGDLFDTMTIDGNTWMLIFTSDQSFKISTLIQIDGNF